VSYRFRDASGPQSSGSPLSAPLLPTRDYFLTHPVPSKEEIHRQFRRLDLFGEGRLTYLNLKSALELILEDSGRHRSDGIDDFTIRSWLRDNDGGSKGFVDFQDFLAIFPFNSGKSHSQASSSRLHGSASAPVVTSDRIDRIRRTFQKYDVNGDGLIDAEDLSKIFHATGKTVEKDEIREWVRKRDSKGIGAVCFEDFLAHFA
jgi:Ca2+-binding EF-hand superfamily protein